MNIVETMRKSKKQILADNQEFKRENALLAQTVNHQNATIQMLNNDINGFLARIHEMNTTIIDQEVELKTLRENHEERRYDE
jgi:hypothetical protein